MTPELQKHYEEQFSMFLTEGWKEFIEACNELKTQYSDLLTVPDAPALHKRHGQLDILNWVINRKAAHEATFKVLQEESEE